MSAKSTQRFVGLVVAVVATVLLLMALPSKQDRVPEEAAEDADSGPVDPRTILPVYEVVDGWWVLTRYGIRMRLPEGWEPKERNDRPYAYRNAESALRGNLNVLSLPNFFCPDLAAVAEENEKALSESEQLELISIEEVTLGGDHAALRVDYRGRPASDDLRLSAIVFLLGGHQVVITATAHEAEWGAVEEVVRTTFESIEMLDLPTMDRDEQFAAARQGIHD